MIATRRGWILAGGLAATVVATGLAHDLFLKPEQFFLAEQRDAVVRVLNGTFASSENSIARARLVDISLVSPSGREAVDTSRWGVTGDTSAFRFRTGAAGTYVLGVSTRPNMITLAAKDFNDYLASDGVPDVLEARRTAGELETGARERYAKHVKAVVQVGAARSGEYATVLGYPAEIVPLENPYTLKAGGTLRVRLLVDGKPVAGQYVLSGGRTSSGARIQQRNTRSDGDGVATVRLATPGTWYIKFIRMVRLSGDAEADYESKWATLTFAVQ